MSNYKWQARVPNMQLLSNRLFTACQTEPAGSGKCAAWDWSGLLEREHRAGSELRGRDVGEQAAGRDQQRAAKIPSQISPFAPKPLHQESSSSRSWPCPPVQHLPEPLPAAPSPHLSPDPQLTSHHPDCLLSETLETSPFLLLTFFFFYPHLRTCLLILERGKGERERELVDVREGETLTGWLSYMS